MVRIRIGRDWYSGLGVGCCFARLFHPTVRWQGILGTLQCTSAGLRALREACKLPQQPTLAKPGAAVGFADVAARGATTVHPMEPANGSSALWGRSCPPLPSRQVGLGRGCAQCTLNFSLRLPRQFVCFFITFLSGGLSEHRPPVWLFGPTGLPLWPRLPRRLCFVPLAACGL